MFSTLLIPKRDSYLGSIGPTTTPPVNPGVGEGFGGIGLGMGVVGEDGMRKTPFK
jgi:hypothetical protein